MRKILMWVMKKYMVFQKKILYNNSKVQNRNKI